MKKQRILSFLLAMVMTVSLLPGTALAAKTEDFTDVSKNDWFYKYVDFVADEKYFVGTSETTFSPEMPMTRAMFVVVLAALEGVKVDNNVAPFADVSAGTWYSGAVKWAADNGVVAGVGGGKFAPDTAISREQMAVMMNAYVDWHSEKHGEDHREKAQVESFGDADDVSSWAVKGVENCRGWGLIAGAPDGNFYPQNTATRAEVATVIYNLAWLVYGGGSGSGPRPTYTDYIYEAVDGALADVLETVANNGVNTDKNDNGSVSYQGSSVEITGVKVNKPNDKLAAREQSVTATVTANSETVEAIANFAVEKATSIVAALAAGESTDAIVKENAEIVSQKAEALANQIVNKLNSVFGTELALDNLNKAAITESIKTAYAKGTEYGKKLWNDHFIIEENGVSKYVTDDITVTVGETEFVLNVDRENKQTTLDREPAALIKDMSVAIAKELYADLLTNEGEFVAVSAIDPSVKIGILFSAGDFASHTDKYSYSYPLTLTLDLAGTAADNIQYMYDSAKNEHNVKLVVTDKMVELYEGYAEQIVGEVTMNVSDIVADKAQDVVKTYEGDEFDEILAGIAEDGFLSRGVYAGICSVIKDSQYGEAFDALDDDIKLYIVSLSVDKLLTQSGYEPCCVYDQLTQNAQNAAANMEISDLTELAEKAGYTGTAYDKYIEKIEKLQDPAAVKQMKLSNLAAAIREAGKRGIEIELPLTVAEMVEMLPAKASVEIDGRLVISEATIENFLSKNNDNVYEAVADMIETIGDLCLADFEDGVKVEAAYGENYDVTVNLFIGK